MQHAPGNTFPTAITVSIAGVRGFDTPVTVTAVSTSIGLGASSTSTLNLTIPAGQTSVAVPVVGLTADAASELSATTGTGAALTQTVNVLDYTQRTPVLTGFLTSDGDARPRRSRRSSR